MTATDMALEAAMDDLLAAEAEGERMRLLMEAYRGMAKDAVELLAQAVTAYRRQNKTVQMLRNDLAALRKRQPVPLLEDDGELFPHDGEAQSPDVSDVWTEAS